MPEFPETWRHLCRMALALTFLAGAAPACSRPPAEEALNRDVPGPPAAQEHPAANAAPAAASPVRRLTVANRPARGAVAARVIFIEYSDYGCPFCAQYFKDVYPRLIREYVDSGKLRYVFKNYPIEGLHPGTFKAHVAAACAGDQGRYWEMHDRLFGSGDGLQAARQVAHARGAGLDLAAFQSCVAGPDHEALIRQDLDEAVRGGVTGAPVFVLALAGPDRTVVTPVRVVVGAQPYQVFQEAIDAVLAQAATGVN